MPPYKKIGCLHKRENNDMLIKKDKTVQRYIEKSSSLREEQQEKIYIPLRNELSCELENVIIDKVPKKEKPKQLKILNELKEGIKLLGDYINIDDTKIYVPNNGIQIYSRKK